MLRGGASSPPTTRAKEEDPTRSSPPSSYGAKFSDFMKISHNVETLSRELNMHFIGFSCFNSTGVVGFTQDSPLVSLNDSRVVTNLGEVGIGSVTRIEQVNMGPPFREGGLFLCPPLIEGPLSTFFFMK